MNQTQKSDSAATNGRLWGTRARDWADLQEVTARSVYEAVLERTAVGSGTRYLDVGCGAGLATQLAAARGAAVWGFDASEALLEIARERVPGGDYRLGDLQDLPYGTDSFDVVSGFNSFQFAVDPGVALAEARRVSSPGGTVAMVTWGDPEGMEAASVVKTLGSLLPPPPTGAPGPFALSDEIGLRRFASDAGLQPVEVFDVPHAWTYRDQETALRAATSAGVAVRAIEHSGESTVRDALGAVIAPYRRPDGSYRMMASFRCLIATS